MKIVAAVLAASLGLVFTGCALDRNVDGPATVDAESQNDRNPGASRLMVAEREDARQVHLVESGTAVAQGAPAEALGSSDSQLVPHSPAQPTQPAAPVPKTQNGSEQGGRDAKEATEEAARKIYGAAVGAASIIREVGREAVQSVLDVGGREKDAAEAGTHADEARFPSAADAQGDDVSMDEARGSGAVQQ